MRLDQLPADIIIGLPCHLHSLDDLYSLVRTCRAFHQLLADSTARLPPAFARRHGQPLFPPHPHLLIAGSARSVADWAIRAKGNEVKLRAALKGGVDGLHQLCCDEGRMSFAQARALTAAKYDLLNPVSKLVDEAVGPAQREAKYRGQGRTLDDDEEWWTICEYPELALLNHWIYCELFHHDVDALVDPASAPKQLSLKTRILFLRFCIPDCNDKIERVPQEIVDQVCGYARSPWESSKHGTSLGCFMMIQELLYRSPSPFSSETIMDALDEEADSVDTASDSSTGSQVGPAAVVDDEEPSEPPSVELLLNTILHRPLLAFRLLLPGGEAATKADVELLRAKCDEPSAAERWTDACRSYEDQDVDLVSLGEDSTVRRDREGEVSYRQGPDGPVELRDQSLINTWKWLHIERDCGRIIWDQ